MKDESLSPGTQTWTAASYHAHARFVSDLGSPLLDLLNIRPGERVLDLGCGDGALTEKLVAAGAHVVGIDTASDLLTAAAARGLDVRLMSGEQLAFVQEFDAVFSNAALHWMQNVDAVLDGVRRALKSGGRFVGEFGGHGNVASVVVALRAVLSRRGLDPARAKPWYFPTRDEYFQKLEAAGFSVEHLELFPRPTPLPTDLHGWLEVFAPSVLGQLVPHDQLAAREEVVDLLKPALCDSQGRWTIDYVRLRFSARLKSHDR
ncbi:class I SAM-dependent methyltransferase [Candidatus Nitrospira bockiana]